MTADRVHSSTPVPGGFTGARVRLYSEAFCADPHRVYREMRETFGSLAPVELAPDVPATLVLGYDAARAILNDPDRFPADPRIWERGIPAECPVRPMMGWRPNPIRSAGADHTRYRAAVGAALSRVDLHRLHGTVEQIAVPLINSFCDDGQCEVVTQYVLPLVVGTLNMLLGCTPEISERATAGMTVMFDAVDAVGAERGNQILVTALSELVSIKRDEPGDDVTSWLIEHPVGLDDEEMVQQLVLLYLAGASPPQNLIVNTLLLMTTDERFAGHVHDGSLSTLDALNEVLFCDPPMANYCISYPRRPVLIDNVWLPANQPVVISMAACNNDPAIRAAGEVTGNRSHLAFSAGPHACPARSPGLLIAQDAIDQLLDALPELELAVPATELSWRPGPFHRALGSLPVNFPPSPPIRLVPLGNE